MIIERKITSFNDFHTKAYTPQELKLENNPYLVITTNFPKKKHKKKRDRSFYIASRYTVAAADMTAWFNKW